MRALLLVAGLAPACTIPNPAFDVAGATGTTTSSTSSGGELTGPPPTTGATDAPDDTGSSTVGEATAVITGGMTTSETAAASTGDSDDSTGDSSTGDATTGEPGGCWGQGAAGWPFEGTPLDTFIDKRPADPILSPDGLRIHYVALDPPRPFVSTRPSPGDPFPNGKQVALWGNDPNLKAAYPNVVLDGAEMLLSINFDVYSATATPAKPDKFALPVPLLGPNTAHEESVITATADSATLIVTRRDGPPILPVLDSGSFRFYQYTRAQLQPGAPYVGGADVTPQVGPLGLALCPALSPDGLHLFFASTTSDTLTDQNANDVVGIFYTSRPEGAASWAPPQPIGIAHAGKGVTCPSSVTADGCQLAFHRFIFKGDDYSMHLATRAP